MGRIEEIGRYIDGTLQDDVHPSDVEFDRIPGTGREIGDGWGFDAILTLHGHPTRVTITVSPGA